LRTRQGDYPRSHYAAFRPNANSHMSGSFCDQLQSRRNRCGTAWRVGHDLGLDRLPRRWDERLQNTNTPQRQLRECWYHPANAIAQNRSPGWRRSADRTRLRQNSLQTGNISGISTKFNSEGQPQTCAGRAHRSHFLKFPTRVNRESLSENKEFDARSRERDRPSKLLSRSQLVLQNRTCWAEVSGSASGPLSDLCSAAIMHFWATM
jgi:hypothetical protein